MTVWWRPASRSELRFVEPDRARRWHDLAPILATALLVRLAVSSQDITYHADEVWQYLEPAYGLVTGRWIATWEFHAQVRGWLIPMIILPMVALGHALAPATRLDIWLVHGVLSLASLGVVAAFSELGGRISRQHGLIAGWVAATWVEIIRFGPRCSGETIALSLLMPAIALLYRLRERASFKTAVLAGCLLGLGAIARFQYLPAIALLVGWTLWHRCESWLALLLGCCLALGLGAVADGLNGQTPLIWIYTNYAVNLGQDRSAVFGTAAPDWYLLHMIATWGWCTAIIVPMALIGARRLPLPAAMVLVIIATHMLVPHKEYRFILLAVVLLVLLAAIGSVDLAQGLARRDPALPLWTTPLLGALWLGMSVTVALHHPFAGYWGAGRDILRTLVDVGKRPDLCGLAYYRPPSFPRASYAYLNRDVPILLFDGPAAAAAATANQSRYNVAISPRPFAAGLPRGYRLDHCLSATQPWVQQSSCVYVRTGHCSGGAGDFDYNRVLTRQGY